MLTTGWIVRSHTFTLVCLVESNKYSRFDTKVRPAIVNHICTCNFTRVSAINIYYKASHMKHLLCQTLEPKSSLKLFSSSQSLDIYIFSNVFCVSLLIYHFIFYMARFLLFFYVTIVIWNKPRQLSKKLVVAYKRKLINVSS